MRITKQHLPMIKIGVSLTVMGIIMFGSLFHYIRSLQTPSFQAHHFAWLPEMEYVYELEWTATQQTSLDLANGKQNLNDSVNFVAEISLTPVSNEKKSEFWLSYKVLKVKQASMTVLEKELFPTSQAAQELFLGREASVQALTNGEFPRIRYKKSDPELFKNLAQAVLTQMQIVLRPEESEKWQRTEPRLHGVALVEYKRVGDPSDLVFTRIPLHFQQILGLKAGPSPQDIKSFATFTLSAEGHLLSLNDHENFSMQDEEGRTNLQVNSRFHVTFKEKRRVETPGAVVATEDFELRALRQFVTTPAITEKLLHQRVGAMTFEQLAQDLLQHGNSGEMPNHNKWFWQATGLLKLTPVLCPKLVTIFAKNKIGKKGQALILDLLASAGNSEAQLAMRQILVLPKIEQGIKSANLDLLLLYQRFSFVEHPDASTIEFLRTNFEQARNATPSNLRIATAYTLGSAAGNLRLLGDPIAGDLSNVLASELKASSEPIDQSALLRALGNAGTEEHASTILEYADSSEESVRESAATALRKWDTPEVNFRLINFFKDPSLSVQETAMQALDGHVLSLDNFSTLRNTVLSGATSPEADAFLVTLIVRPQIARSENRSDIVKMLNFILTRSTDAPNLQARIRSLLAQDFAN